MKRIAIGLMSGTSMDGIDAAVVEIHRRGRTRTIKALGFVTVPYPAGVRKRLLDVTKTPNSLSRLSEISALNFTIGEHFAAAALKAMRQSGLTPGQIDLIGSHGQTVGHFPQAGVPSTLQLGEPAVIAHRTGVTTVADFRPADIAVGGEGAPLTPYVHYLLFRHGRKSRAIHNLGGISNLTYIPAGGSLEDVIAFDTGPGNVVIDEVCRRTTGGKKALDRGGRMARRGRVREELLRDLLRHPFFSRRPPKSTGREEFGAAYVAALMRKAKGLGIAPLDLLATVTAFTARSIGEAYRRFVLRLGRIDEIYFAGGGRKNRTLMEMLAKELGFAKVSVVEEAGLDGDALEAQAFALLADEAVEGAAANLSRVTGAEREVVLGKIVPGRNYQGVKLKSSKFNVQR